MKFYQVKREADNKKLDKKLEPFCRRRTVYRKRNGKIRQTMGKQKQYESRY